MQVLLLFVGALLQQAAAAANCTAYGFWTDKGCRTWSTPCTQHDREPTSKIETLSVRTPGTDDFAVAGKGVICKGEPDFRDGPRATPTDAACREHCLRGDHGGGHHGPPPPPPLPVGAVDLTVHTDATTHQISNLSMGCHSDSGYAHQARGFYAQLIVGDSFNATDYPDGKWNTESTPGATFTAAADPTEFYGTPSERLSLYHARGSGGEGVGSISNRGLGNAGLVLESGKPYEGFLFAALPKEQHPMGPVSLLVTLEDYTAAGKKVLATQTLVVEAGAGFARFNFTLTPSASTSCVDIAPGSDPLVSCGHGRPRSSVGHTCQKCGGEFKLTLTTPGSVLLNYVYLSPGQWGRLPGLPVLASAGSLLKEMGVTAIRQGGSYASGGGGGSTEQDKMYYQWEKWTGPAWTRGSRRNGVWRSCLLAGWGPFEMIDMCNALGIEPVITTTETSSVQQFADLVEYCHGNASTKMGQRRIADGHPSNYDVKFFELGNEQYNPQYVEQVAAMEAKARELGIGRTIHYMFPQNGFLNEQDIAKASALSPRIDDLMVADLHVGGGGAVQQARALFAQNPEFKMGAVNAETNAGTHTFDRAMSEAKDLNDWFNADIVSAGASNRLHFRAASFCMGDATDFDAWDQGISFFLNNMTWLQPPGQVHKMISQTWQPNALSISVVDSTRAVQGAPLASAQKSDDGKTLVLRYVNFGSATSPTAAAKVTVHLKTKSGVPANTAGAATVWTLQSSDGLGANPPGEPARISPKTSTLSSFADGTVLTVPGNSYVIVQVPLA